MFLLRIRWGSVGFSGYVRGRPIAIAVGVAPIDAGQDAAWTSYRRGIAAFGPGGCMGFHPSDFATSARLLRSLVVLVDPRRGRHDFIFLAFRHVEELLVRLVLPSGRAIARFRGSGKESYIIPHAVGLGRTCDGFVSKARCDADGFGHD